MPIQIMNMLNQLVYHQFPGFKLSSPGLAAPTRPGAS